MIKQSKQISFVIPVYNEEHNIISLLEEIQCYCKEYNVIEFEIIIIDDGSSDNTPMVIKNYCLQNDKIIFYKLRKNFGKSTALKVGFETAKFDYIITLDGDL